MANKNKQLIEARGDHIETVNNAYAIYLFKLARAEGTYTRDVKQAENKRLLNVKCAYTEYREIKEEASRKFKKIRKELGEPL